MALIFCGFCLSLFQPKFIVMAGESKEGIEMRKMIDAMGIDTISVKHMEDSSKYNPIGFKSWKDFWESKIPNAHFPSKLEKCACCNEDTQPKDFVGAHVVSIENSDKMYIYPLCKTCNDTYGKRKAKSPIFEVKKSLCADFSLSEAKIEHLEE